MDIDYQKLRIEGIYRQNKAGQLMQRIKLSGGVLSVCQARAVSRLAESFGSGVLHLTTRGSLELHSLEYEDLEPLQQGLSAVGLFSRGACGGAVRGVSCSTGFGTGYEKTQVLGRRLLNYFSGNPYFEGLPKKFKIAVEADYRGSRHLIQDLALVYVGENEDGVLYDVWLAGGLGREPQAGFLYQEQAPEGIVLPLVEAVIDLYREGASPGRRLKHLLNDIGKEEFLRRLAEKLTDVQGPRFSDAFSKALLPAIDTANDMTITVPVFAGELPAAKLGMLALLAENVGLEYLLLNTDQDVVLSTLKAEAKSQLITALRENGFPDVGSPCRVMRVCPGNHECSMGLAPTRDLARELSARLGDRLDHVSIAISGCPNSCAQPQLADYGIIASKLPKGEDGVREPRFDLCRRIDDGLGQKIEEQLTSAELLDALDRLV